MNHKKEKPACCIIKFFFFFICRNVYIYAAGSERSRRYRPARWSDPWLWITTCSPLEIWRQCHLLITIPPKRNWWVETLLPAARIILKYRWTKDILSTSLRFHLLIKNSVTRKPPRRLAVLLVSGLKLSKYTPIHFVRILIFIWWNSNYLQIAWQPMQVFGETSNVGE
jgi:hypothetical protein